MGLEIIIPEATTNICINPSFGIDISRWDPIQAGTTITRVLNRSRFGRAGLEVNTPGGVPGEGTRYSHNPDTVVGPTPVTASIYVRGRGQVFLILSAVDNGMVWTSKAIGLNDRYWQRMVVTGNFPNDETNLRLEVLTYYNQSSRFYVDGAQLELKGHPTTYADGDMELELNPHDGNLYFEWVGQRHATASTRSKAYRQGGEVKELTQGLDSNIFPIDVSGLGMPPVNIQMQTIVGQERGFLQGIQATPRSLGLTMHARRLPNSAECDPKSLAALHQARRALEDAIKADKSHKTQAFILRYRDGKCPMDLEAVYEAGMEFDGDIRDPYYNSFGMRLLAPNPYWLSDSQDAAELDTSTVVEGGHAYLVARLAGEWQGFGSASFPIRVLAVHPNGDVYAGGDFENIGGVACRRIARWDGTQWNILAGAGNDIDDGAVYAIDFAPTGDVYIGGSFVNIGGVAHNHVTRYSPSGDSFNAMGGASPGVNSDVNAIAVNRDGFAYLGGAFTQANQGPVAAYRVIRYNGPTPNDWTTLGTFAGLNADVEAMEIDLDGTTLYLGGDFTNEFSVGGAALLERICKFTTALGFEAMAENGLNDACRALKMGLDGKLYLGGDFTTAGFWTVAKVAVWNRNEFYPLGSDGDGLTGGNRVNVIDIDARGQVFFGGDFTGATNDDLVVQVGIWTGTRFAHLDIVVGAEVVALASKFDKLFLGYLGASVTAIADVQTVENEGKASAHPILDIRGPLVIRYLENQETGKVVRFNLTALAGERLLVDLRPGYLKAVSEWRGNIMYAIMPDSDFGDFAILPGSNQIAFLGTDGNGDEEASLRWRTTDWSFDDAR